MLMSSLKWKKKHVGGITAIFLFERFMGPIVACAVWHVAPSCWTLLSRSIFSISGQKWLVIIDRYRSPLTPHHYRFRKNPHQTLTFRGCIVTWWTLCGLVCSQIRGILLFDIAIHAKMRPVAGGDFFFFFCQNRRKFSTGLMPSQQTHGKFTKLSSAKARVLVRETELTVSGFRGHCRAQRRFRDTSRVSFTHRNRLIVNWTA